MYGLYLMGFCRDAIGVGPPIWVGHSADLYFRNITMKKKCISIFTDESGDYGLLGHNLINSDHKYQDNFYIISFVFHNQNIDISNAISYLNASLNEYHFTNDNDKYVHFGPLIRRENEFYKAFKVDEVRDIIFKFSKFIKHLEIKYLVIVLDKRYVNNELEFKTYFIDALSTFFKENEKYFKQFTKAIEYYDSGQNIVKEIILDSVEHVFKDNEPRMKIKPQNYRLAQVCDFLCTMELIVLKRKCATYNGNEKDIFNDKKAFKKNIRDLLVNHTHYLKRTSN